MRLLDSKNWTTVTYMNPAGCNQSSLLLWEQVGHTDFSPYTQVARGLQSAKPNGGNCCYYSLLWLNTSGFTQVVSQDSTGPLVYPLGLTFREDYPWRKNIATCVP